MAVGVESLAGHEAQLAGRHIPVDAIVWATGFRCDHTIVRVPAALDANGLLSHDAGVTAVPGLFVVGQPWQRTRGSALLGFVGDDAKAIAECAVAHLWRDGPRARVVAVRQGA